MDAKDLALATKTEDAEPPAEHFAPEVPSRHIGTIEHLLISSYWFGSNFVWGALLAIINQMVMADLAPDRQYILVARLSALGAFPALVVPLVAGALSDRCTSRWGRRRPYILAGGAVAVVGLLSLLAGYMMRSLEIYFVAFFVLQFGANTALAAYSGIIPDVVPRDQHGVASGFMALMSQLSTLLGLLVGGLLFAKHPVTVFFILAVVYVVFVALTVVGVKETPLKVDPGSVEWGAYIKSLWIDPKKYPDFAWVWITRALMMIGFYAVQPYVLYFLRDVIKVANPTSQGAYVFMAILVAATFSGFAGGAVSDRIGRKPVVYFSSLLIGVMALSFIFLTNLTQVLFCGVLFGVGYGAYISVDWALGTEVLPTKEDAGKDMGVWHVSMTLPQQLAPYFAGAILQHYATGGPIEAGQGHANRTGYGWVFAIASVCFVLGGILLRKVKSVS